MTWISSLRGGPEDARWDAEEIEDLVQQVGDLGCEDLDDSAVAQEHMALRVAEQAQELFGRRPPAAAACASVWSTSVSRLKYQAMRRSYAMSGRQRGVKKSSPRCDRYPASAPVAEPASSPQMHSATK